MSPYAIGLIILAFGSTGSEENEEGSYGEEVNTDKSFVTEARVRGGTRHLRFKRSAGEEDGIRELNLELQTPLLKNQSKLKLQLHQRRPSTIVSPYFKLVIRDEDGKEVDYNSSVSKDSGHFAESCLFKGVIEGVPGSSVSVSSCDDGELNGIMLIDDQNFVIEPASRNRKKRDSNDEDAMVNIHRSLDSFGKCGVNPGNKMRQMELYEDDWRAYRKSRIKRDGNSKKKAIEIAVFVDDILYDNVKESLETTRNDHEAVVDKIQNIVFTYLNSVQLLYESERLSTTFELILVRLDVAKKPVPNLKKHSNIEKYLESFCSWQKSINPGGLLRGDREIPDHWDHGLMLTGLNLYDKSPKYDNVIGLAWVSGMCHPSFSCTINEGNNFESVYVIAHEMGHSLGMNHDGEKNEGNNCNPDKFLMSPILGPGKVTWSPCSDQEIQHFLNGRQASCLDDLPQKLDEYNYEKAQQNKFPGELYTAYQQCTQAFGKGFKPHRKDARPFENVCRELWCSNRTHALRAHPALEGTDCHHKPFPYGSICHMGKCEPFYPDGTRLDNQTLDPSLNDISENALIDGRPAWYDPLFTEIFIELKERYALRYFENGEEF